MLITVVQFFPDNISHFGNTVSKIILSMKLRIQEGIDIKMIIIIIITRMIKIIVLVKL